MSWLSIVKGKHKSCVLCPHYYFYVSCVWTIGLANWNKGTERDGNEVLPKSAVSNQGHKGSLQQGTEELCQHRL